MSQTLIHLESSIQLLVKPGKEGPLRVRVVGGAYADLLFICAGCALPIRDKNHLHSHVSLDPKCPYHDRPGPLRFLNVNETPEVDSRYWQAFRQGSFETAVSISLPNCQGQHPRRKGKRIFTVKRDPKKT